MTFAGYFVNQGAGEGKRKVRKGYALTWTVEQNEMSFIYISCQPIKPTKVGSKVGRKAGHTWNI